MNYDLNLADHNIFCNIRVDQERPADDNSLRIYGPAVRADCNEKLVVVNNFFGQVENQAVSFNLAQSERRHDGRTGLCFSNAAVNNIFYKCPNRILLARINDNKTDRNIYDINNDNFSFALQYPSPMSYQNLSGWQEYFRLDTLSTQAVIDASFDLESNVLTLQIKGEVQDYSDISVNGLTISYNYPGPFKNYSKKEAGIIGICVKFPLED
jgi:hypothetical protein